MSFVIDVTMVSQSQVIILIAFFASALMAYPQKALLDPIDMCILTCDECYKGSSLMDCANDCIMTGGRISAKWITTCHRFKNPIYGLGLENEI